MSKIIAVDFDGTLFTNDWPYVGTPIWSTINDLIREQAQGAKVILWTNRKGEELDAAIDACMDAGIKLDAVNQNLPEMIEFFGGDTRKIFANEYWDDRAVFADEYGIHKPAEVSAEHIEDLERLKCEIEWDHSLGYQAALDGAIEALKTYRENTPKKPVYKRGVSGSFYHCSCCDTIIHPYGIKRCIQCGQLADWRD